MNIAVLPTLLFPLLFIVTISQRVLELRRSSRNQQLMNRHRFILHDSDLSYRIMVLIHASWFPAMVLERSFAPTGIPIALQYLALVVFLSAQLLRIWAIRSLGIQWNVRIMGPSHTTPAPFIAHGPYRHLRHPNYLAVILEFASLPLLASAPVTAALWTLLNAAVLRHRIIEEEKLLFARSGYAEVMGSLPRLIPGLRRLRQSAGQ